MNRKLYAFMAMLCLFVMAFIWHIQKLQCEDSAGFDLGCHKMYMSFGVLFCIGILLLAAAGFYIFLDPPSPGADHAAKNVFDSFAKQLIPIATLVLDYYFGTTSGPLSLTEKSAGKGAIGTTAASAPGLAPERK